MKVKKVRCIIVLILALSIVQATSAKVWAQETVVRPAAEMRLPGVEMTSGLLRVPSAYIQRNREVTAFVAGVQNVSGGALVGIGQRLELGLGVGAGDSGDGRVLGSAKFNIVPEALMTPAVSVGVLDAFDSSDVGRSGYLVVSKSVIPYFVEALTGRQDIALKLHAGYGGGLYKRRLFVGAEVWGAHGVGVLGEISAGRVNVGARYYRRGFGATLGWLEWKRIGASACYTVPLH